jgi:hypothetical protein
VTSSQIEGLLADETQRRVAESDREALLGAPASSRGFSTSASLTAGCG